MNQEISIGVIWLHQYSAYSDFTTFFPHAFICVCVCVCSRFTHYTYTTNQDTELFNQHQKTYSLLFYFASKEGKFIEIEN
jgi:hypothetical protein